MMRRLILVLPFLLSAPVVAPAMASDDDWVPPVTDPLVQAECGSCHMAFQPAFLPARSWQVMMDGLKDHFGDDASLPPEKVAHITDYLVANAGRDRTGGQAPQRITELRWFAHEHDFPDRVWKRPDVVTKSNCIACHAAAEKGSYED